MERVIITTLCYHGTDCRVAAWQSNGKISRICLEDPREERLLGSIHVGKVQKILPDIKGAFVEIENRTSCYFPYTKESNFLYTMPKKASELRAGDELLVQVTREAIKTKAPCVSSNLNFIGKYLVLTTGNRTLGISAKIPSGKREKLKEFLEELMPEDCSYGIILRTNGALASAEELKEELRSLETQFTQLYQKALHTPCYTKLSKGESITASILKDVHWKETEKIITDQKTLYEELCVSRQDIPVASMCAIEYYEDSLLPLARLYNLERELDQALQEKVFACENIEMVWDSVPLEILGQDEVTGLKIRNIKTNEERELTTEGVFVAVGIVPNTTLVKDQLKLDENGYICAGEEGVTSAPGVFAAGDIRTKALRQIVTAVSDGANAVASAQKYLWRKDNGND